MNALPKNVAFLTVLLVVASAILSTVVRTNRARKATVTYSQFMLELEHGNVEGAAIRGGANAAAAVLSMKDGRTMRTVLPADYRNELSAMQAKSVSIDIEESDSNGWVTFLVNASPFLVLLAFWIAMVQWVQRKGQRGPAVPVG